MAGAGWDEIMSVATTLPLRSDSLGVAAGFSPEQQRYLEGFFAGVQSSGVTFGDLAAEPAAGWSVRSRTPTTSGPARSRLGKTITVWLLGSGSGLPSAA